MACQRVVHLHLAQLRRSGQRPDHIDRLDNNTSYRCATQSYARTGTGTISSPTYELPNHTVHYLGECSSGTADGWSTTDYDSAGNPTAVHNYTTSTNAITTSTAYDGYGRPTSSTDGNGNSTTTQYGALFVNPMIITTTDPLGHTTVMKINPGRGLPESVQDANGNIVTGAYDSLGRLIKVWRPSDGVTPGQEWNPTGGSPSATYAYQAIAFTDTTKTVTGHNMVTTTAKQNGGSTSAYTYPDGYGRTFETATAASDGSTSATYTATFYDAEGRTVRQTLPFALSSTTPDSGLQAVPAIGVTETDAAYDACLPTHQHVHRLQRHHSCARRRADDDDHDLLRRTNPGHTASSERNNDHEDRRTGPHEGDRPGRPARHRHHPIQGRRRGPTDGHHRREWQPVALYLRRTRAQVDDARSRHRHQQHDLRQ